MKTKCLYPTVVINNEVIRNIEISRKIVIDGVVTDVTRHIRYLRQYLYGLLKGLPRPNFDRSDPSWVHDLEERHSFIEDIVERFRYVFPSAGVFVKQHDMLPLFTVSHCGKCPFCKKKRQNEWAMRVHLETNQYEYKPYFVTLTYDEDHIPVNYVPFKCGLNKKHLQGFIKRLRNYIEDSGYSYQRPDFGFRYFACGEYGSKRGRCHYHLICENVPHPYNNMILDLNWFKRLCKKAWNYGDFGATHRDSRGYPGKDMDIMLCDDKVGYYVTKYVTKSLDNEDEYIGQKPFILYSRNPGIGFLPDTVEKLVTSFHSCPWSDRVVQVDRFTNTAFDVPLTRSVSRRVYPSKCVVFTKYSSVPNYTVIRPKPKCKRCFQFSRYCKDTFETEQSRIVIGHNLVNEARYVYDYCNRFLHAHRRFMKAIGHWRSLNNDENDLYASMLYPFFTHSPRLDKVKSLLQQIKESFSFLSFNNILSQSVRGVKNMLSLVTEWNDFSGFDAFANRMVAYDWPKLNDYFKLRDLHTSHMLQLETIDVDLVAELSSLERKRKEGEAREIF